MKIENLKDFSGEIESGSQHRLKIPSLSEDDRNLILKEGIELAGLYDEKFYQFEYEITPQISDSLIEVAKFTEKLDIEYDLRGGARHSITLRPVTQEEYDNFVDNINKAIDENQNNPELFKDLNNFKAGMEDYFEQGYLVSGLNTEGREYTVDPDGKVFVHPDDYYPNSSNFGNGSPEKLRIYKLFDHIILKNE